jgi:NAD(P)-dependent dehydrogenase (short-subunit alcohol dehydrogenase family)
MSKIALITGGSRGLGKNSALHIADKGIDVVVTYREKAAEAKAVVEEIQKKGRKAAALALDVSNTKTFSDFAVEFENVLKNWGPGKYDFLVNNAGSGICAPFVEVTEAQFDSMMNVHLKSVFFLTQKLLPLMNDGGRIINLSSGLARFAYPGYAAYATMKGGIEVLSRYLAKELGPRKISCNVVAPGAIETDFGGGMVRDNQQVNAMIASQTALGRVGVPDDIGGIVAALCTEDTRWVNAQRIEASGGQGI